MKNAMKVISPLGLQGAANIVYEHRGSKDCIPIRVEPSGRVVAIDATQILIVDKCIEPFSGKPFYLQPLDKPSNLNKENLFLGLSAPLVSLEKKNHTYNTYLLSDYDNFPEYESFLPPSVEIENAYVAPSGSHVPLDVLRIAPTLAILASDDWLPRAWYWIDSRFLRWGNYRFRYYVDTYAAFLL